MSTGSALSACGFSFSYPGAHAGIGPLDWNVPQGAFQLLVGGTGSGKTTLLRCCKPALAPEGARSGELAAFGRPVDALDAREAACLIGYVAQSPENQMVCDSVWHELAFGLENVGTPPDEMRRRVAEVAHFFGIEPWFRRSTDALSGGQKQMVTLAGVLVMQPRLLLLDEPTAQLDPVAEKSFLHALFRVNRELGITVVVATHAPEAVAAYATDAAELAEGRLRAAPLERFAARPLDVRQTEPLRPSGPFERPEPFDSSATSSASASLSAGEGAAKESPLDAKRASGIRSLAGNRASAAARTSGIRPAIAVSDAYYRYAREDDWVLRGLDLEVRAGGVHALVGGNGCGKSTLLRLVAGVLKPERGRAANRLAARQALLPQDPKALFACDSVEEELREWQGSCGYADADVAAALARFGLETHAKIHPYDLSGGQQQMLAFAKLLLCDPDLLLLDEPTKGLDAESKRKAAQVCREAACGGKTVLLATHDLTFAALVADEVTMLFDGEAACTEPAAAFFEGNLFYRPQEDAFARLWRKGDR